MHLEKLGFHCLLLTPLSNTEIIAYAGLPCSMANKFYIMPLYLQPPWSTKSQFCNVISNSICIITAMQDTRLEKHLDEYNRFCLSGPDARTLSQGNSQLEISYYQKVKEIGEICHS
ncbi:hypothetical protein AKJ16_DCAP27284 [Drosera capensis]